jgi:hypothetical protein
MQLCKSCVRFDMSEKLLDEMTFKLTYDVKRRLQGLAEADGLTASELVRRLIEAHLDERERHFRALISIFGDQPTSLKE